MGRPDALVGALAVSRGVRAAGETCRYEKAFGQLMILGILQPDFIDRERGKRLLDQRPQYLSGDALGARERLEHNTHLGSALDRIDLLQATDSDLPLCASHRHREEEPPRWTAAHQGNGYPKTSGSPVQGHLGTDVTHRIRVGEQLAIQRLVTFGQRTDFEPLCVNVKQGRTVVFEACRLVSVPRVSVRQAGGQEHPRTM